MTHPATEIALSYIKSKPDRELKKWHDIFAADPSTLSSICWETLDYITVDCAEACEDIDIIALAYVMQQGER